MTADHGRHTGSEETTTTMRTRSLAAPAGALTLVAGLTACSADAGTPSGERTSAGTVTQGADTGTTAHNEADTTFARMMVIHHEGAIEMADLAAEKASTQEVRGWVSGSPRPRDPRSSS